MWGLIAIIVVVIVVVGGAVASQEQPKPTQTAEEQQRQSNCEWCGRAKSWYSGLKWYKKAWYSLWLATTVAFCMLNGCGW